jgi:hypothetical protein
LSKQWLEGVIYEGVPTMAAPGGFINPRVMKSAYECGYALVGTCNEWMNSPDTTTLPGSDSRVNVRRHFSIQAFRHIVEGHSAFYLWRQVRAGGLAIAKRLSCRRGHHKRIN